MRGLIFLALSISLCSTLSLCNGADGSGGGDAPASATTGLKPDPNDTTVASLCHIACGDLPCCCHGIAHKGQSIAARLSAIDAIGSLNSPAAIQCLRDLLRKLAAQCDEDSKEHCGCAHFDRTMLALHAIQALTVIGSAASGAQPEISAAICINPDLANAIAYANSVIKPAAPAPKPRRPPRRRPRRWIKSSRISPRRRTIWPRSRSRTSQVSPKHTC